MATRYHYKCLACGTPRPIHCFGIDTEGLDGSPLYESGVAVQEIGGRGQCKWTSYPLSIEDAVALRMRYAQAVEQLDAEIAAAQAES